ncbi:MAG: tRNA pseudouridine(38-40) synthase TruA [Lachnospiraceae bacterium]|nr:tRNA pseudouridine(38-40) synthase TruA [Lachnospiraceae bacterium]
MRRVLLTIAYDGTDFHGFAYQEGVRTVEGAVAEAVFSVTGERVIITGASRTDAGVHAYGNLATFDTESTIPPEKFPYALNASLPEDVRIVNAEDVPADFHPRATGWRKTYEYRILNTPWPDPTLRGYTYHYRTALDTDQMNEAAGYLTGEHDFTSFCSVHSLSPTRVRTVYEARVDVRKAPAQADADAGALVVIRVTGSGFLYHMVRIIAGTLLDVGRGRIKAREIPDILEGRDRARAGMTLPPQGLFLIQHERKQDFRQEASGCEHKDAQA